jgi:two-component system response regulator HydG
MDSDASKKTDNGPPARLLIIDNEAAHARTVAEGLERVGHHCTVADSGPEGAKLIASGEPFDVVITDLMMPKIDGMEILRLVGESLPEAEVIMITGHGTVPSAVEAMQLGAFHYLLKPPALNELRAVTKKAAEAARLRQTNLELNQRLDEKFGFEQFIGVSRQVKEMIDRLRRIAPTDATVLIEGETGTGKELVSQALHQNSPRKKKPFVALNCAALSENILESELFGHVKGAFTDASSNRIGKFEYADGGTLFLDEVGDMPLPTQIKLLRVLENGEITRVGSNDAVRVNVRILSATNRSLEDAIDAGTFRSDLYHRLKVITITIPPLRERTDDVLPLVDHFREHFARRHKKNIKGVSGSVSRKLIGFPWPGNVRQVRNVVESMIVVDTDGVLGEDDLPPELLSAVAPAAGDAVVSDAGLSGLSLDEIERQVIEQRLSLNDGNRELAAQSLGISQRTLYRKIKDYGL